LSCLTEEENAERQNASPKVTTKKPFTKAKFGSHIPFLKNLDFVDLIKYINVFEITIKLCTTLCTAKSSEAKHFLTLERAIFPFHKNDFCKKGLKYLFSNIQH
jgi:hypothetical protein